MTPAEMLRTVVFTKRVMVMTHTIMQNRQRALMWKVVSNHSHMMKAAAAPRPMFRQIQNHRLNCAPARIAAPIVTTMEKPTKPIKGFGKPKASACGVRMTVPQLSRPLMSQTVVWPAST